MHRRKGKMAGSPDTRNVEYVSKTCVGYDGRMVMGSLPLGLQQKQ